MPSLLLRRTQTAEKEPVTYTESDEGEDIYYPKLIWHRSIGDAPV
jgi:hypothetical protein